jgi:glycosyltransferase involved in cell wall biosynthesis
VPDPSHAPADGVGDHVQTLALVSSIAFSLANFRGPLISALVARQVRVLALAPDFDDKTREDVRRLGAEPIDISLERTGMRPGRDLVDAVRLCLQLRRLKPDIALCYFVKPVIYGTLAARFAGVRRRYALVAGLGYVYTPGRSGDSLKRKALRLLVSTLYRLAFQACRRVFFQNEDDIADFVGAGLIDAKRVARLNGTGVDLDRLPFTPPPPGPPSFLLMARLLREKGIGEFVDAARIVRARHPQATFRLLGGLDPNPGGLGRDEVERWAAEGVIEWHGHVDDVRPWIAASSVYVLPSYREGKPRSTQEAMAMGRPVITTDAPGCRDTVEEGVNGFLVPVRDADALADAIERFIANPSLVERMGRASRRLAEQRFDVHRINAEILRVMEIAEPPADRAAAIVSADGCG